MTEHDSNPVTISSYSGSVDLDPTSIPTPPHTPFSSGVSRRTSGGRLPTRTHTRAGSSRQASVLPRSGSDSEGSDVFETLDPAGGPSTFHSQGFRSPRGLSSGGGIFHSTPDASELAIFLEWTDPAIFGPVPEADPLADLVTRYFHRQDRPTRNPSLTATLDGEDYLTVTEELMDSHCWRTLAIYCQRYMTHRRPRDPAIIFRLWHCRFLSLMRLRFYSEMDGELQRLGPLDRTELYYDSHPTIFPDRTGPMVPFEMRVLAAQLPAMMGDIIASLDLVMELSIFSRKMSLLLKEEEGSDEDSFVSSDEESQYSRASEAEGPTSAHEAGLNGLDDIGLEGEGLEEFGQMERPRSKPNRASIVPSPDLSTEWKLRVAPLELLAASYLMKLKDYSAASVLVRKVIKKRENRTPHLLFMAGRLHLQMGDLTEGEYCLSMASAAEGAPPPTVEMHKGLAAISRGDWAVASTHFEEVLALLPGCREAANNLSICKLYRGHLDDATATLEKSIETRTINDLEPTRLENLCTMYELRAGDGGLLRKREILRAAALVTGDDVPPECFKLAI